jgi:hypothetical protein
MGSSITWGTDCVSTSGASHCFPFNRLEFTPLLFRRLAMLMLTCQFVSRIGATWAAGCREISSRTPQNPFDSTFEIQNLGQSHCIVLLSDETSSHIYVRKIQCMKLSVKPIETETSLSGRHLLYRWSVHASCSRSVRLIWPTVRLMQPYRLHDKIRLPL